MNSFWVCLIGLVLMVNSTTAIRCYSCNSKTNGDCAEPKDKIIPSDCTVAGAAAGIQNTWKNFASNFANVDEPTARAVCQKTIFTANGERIIDRSCSLKSNTRDVCAEIGKNNNLEHCSICETDSCNGAVSMKNLWLPMILLPAFAAVFKSFV